MRLRRSLLERIRCAFSRRRCLGPEVAKDFAKILTFAISSTVPADDKLEIIASVARHRLGELAKLPPGPLWIKLEVIDNGR